jgi:lysine decarboxylase
LSEDAPLLDAWLSYVDSDIAPFTIPGHKQAAARLWPELGAVLAGDVPLYGGLDTVKLSTRVLAEAEARAAAFWGGDWCRFSTGGSTHANQVLTLAVAAPGDTVLVTRSAHRSTVSGLVLAGLEPVWLPTTVDSRFGIPAGIDPAQLRSALAAHPEACAVLLVEPSYLGTLSDLPALIAIAHAAGLAVLVDQAWGAHLGFHPGLPDHALRLGADALVLSAHKTLPAYSQASVIVARTGRLDRDRLERAFELTHTTSPAGSILASTDAARALLAHRGPELLGWLIDAVAQARRQLREIPGLLIPGPDDFPAASSSQCDPTKLVVILAGAGVSGIAVERELIEAGLPVEMADLDTVVPIVTMTDTDATIDRLISALRAAIEHHRGQPRPLAAQWSQNQWWVAQSPRSAPSLGPALLPKAAMTPRDAFFAPHRVVDAESAIGRVSAEMVAPYPPGVPVLVPGEVVTAEALHALREAQAHGTRIAYAADPTLGTLQIVS